MTPVERAEREVRRCELVVIGTARLVRECYRRANQNLGESLMALSESVWKLDAAKKRLRTERSRATWARKVGKR